MFSDTLFITADYFIFCQCFSFVGVLCCLESSVAKSVCFAYLLKAALTAHACALFLNSKTDYVFLASF